MGNCIACVRPSSQEEEYAKPRNEARGEKKKKKKKKTKKNEERESWPNPYAEDPVRSPAPIGVQKDVAAMGGRTRIGDKYTLGRGEFGITYLCTDRETREALVKLKATYEDDENVHLIMELCEGGELFDRIVARGHYSERAAAIVARTIAEVVRMSHANGVMHRDLKPENFLFANKK